MHYYSPRLIKLLWARPAYIKVWWGGGCGERAWLEGIRGGACGEELRGEYRAGLRSCGEAMAVHVGCGMDLTPWVLCRVSRHTRLLFMTTGIMLRRLHGWVHGACMRSALQGDAWACIQSPCHSHASYSVGCWLHDDPIAA